MSFWKYCIAVMGGFRFGYSVAIMGSALLFLAPEFNLGAAEQGYLVSAILVGAIIGSALGGPLAERLGRRKAHQVIALLFFIGPLLIISTSSVEMIALGRIIEGLAAGIVSVLGPMYLAEISPPQDRGRNVSCYQLAVTLGILCAYFAGYILSQAGAWRAMFGLSLIPAIIYGIGFFYLPEPQLRPSEEVGSWKLLFHSTHRSSLISALAINIFQQVSGINAVIYFAPSIFEMCGFNSPSVAIFAAVLIGAINFLATIISVSLVDRKGRKPLLFVGVAGMIVGLICLTLACISQTLTGPWVATASLMFYVGSFALGLGPIPSLLASEVFPDSIRSRGMSLALVANWICNFLVVLTFMDLTMQLGLAGTFLIYTLFCTGALLFVWKKVTETKGRAL